MVDRAHRGAGLVAGGVVVLLVGTFLPWLRSGARNRSSYELFDLVERLGFAPDGMVSWALRLWPLVPFVAVSTAVAGWAVAAGRLGTRPFLGSVAVVVVWVGGTALAISLAPDVALFRIGIGPWVSLAGVAVVVAGSVVVSVVVSRPGSGSSAAS